MAWLLYGANGYTGRLTVARALELGERPILAGRSEGPVRELAERHGLEARVFDLADSGAARKALDGVETVIHMAGPFEDTAAPMLEACLAAGAHYADITGEIEVYRHLQTLHERAVAAGVVLVSGVGFDVVPTDCLAAMLAARLPDARRLTLAFHTTGQASRGTARTAVRKLHLGNAVRRDGELRWEAPGRRTRVVDFPEIGPRDAVSIPWGDVETAWYTTQIPDITVYVALPPRLIRGMRIGGAFRALLHPEPVRRLVERWVDRTMPAPDPARAAEAVCHVWGEVQADDGRWVTGALVTPEGYVFTADAAVRVAKRLAQSPPDAGAWTPSRAFGDRFVEDVRDVRVLPFQSGGGGGESSPTG